MCDGLLITIKLIWRLCKGRDGCDVMIYCTVVIVHQSRKSTCDASEGAFGVNFANVKLTNSKTFLRLKKSLNFSKGTTDLRVVFCSLK